jgi:hypothetical protein
VVELQRLGKPARQPLVAGDHLAARAELDPAGAKTHVDLLAGEPGGDRIEALPQRHPGLVVDSVWRQHARRLERRGLQRPQRGLLQRKVVADAGCPPGDVAAVIGQVSVGQVLVELGQRTHDRDGDQMAATEAADLALDAALLVRAVLARSAEERVEAVFAELAQRPKRAAQAP